MSRLLVKIAALTSLVMGCTWENKAHTLAELGYENQPTKTFQFVELSLRKGLRLNGVIERYPAFVNVTYTINCLDNAGASAEDRYRSALTALEGEYHLELPLFFNNPRERGSWWRDANQKTLPYGCEVDDIEQEVVQEIR